jgi:hypothetical protein
MSIRWRTAGKFAFHFLVAGFLEYVFSLPKGIRLPSGKANKYLLRWSFSHLFREELTSQKKWGFSLPLARWIVGPMRDMCEDAIAYLKSLDILHSEDIDSVWKSFIKSWESLRMGRVFGLCVLCLYYRNNGR